MINKTPPTIIDKKFIWDFWTSKAGEDFYIRVKSVVDYCTKNRISPQKAIDFIASRIEGSYAVTLKFFMTPRDREPVRSREYVEKIDEESLYFVLSNLRNEKGLRVELEKIMQSFESCVLDEKIKDETLEEILKPFAKSRDYTLESISKGIAEQEIEALKNVNLSDYITEKREKAQANPQEETDTQELKERLTRPQQALLLRVVATALAKGTGGQGVGDTELGRLLSMISRNDKGEGVKEESARSLFTTKMKQAKGGKENKLKKDWEKIKFLFPEITSQPNIEEAAKEIIY